MHGDQLAPKVTNAEEELVVASIAHCVSRTVGLTTHEKQCVPRRRAETPVSTRASGSHTDLLADNGIEDALMALSAKEHRSAALPGQWFPVMLLRRPGRRGPHR